MPENTKMRIILAVKSEEEYAIFTFGGEDEEDCISWIATIIGRDGTGFHHNKDVDGFIEAIGKGKSKKSK